METPARGALRWARSAALAGSTVVLAATAHTVAGGAVPGWVALAVLTLLTVLACVVFTGRRRGVGSVVVAMTVLQLALHEGFMLMTPMECDASSGVPVTHAAMHGVLPAAPMACLATGSGSGSPHLSASMLGAHALATLLLAAALARGERALWRLRQLVVPRLPHAVPVLPGAPSRPAPATQVVLPTAWTSVSSLVRRGPPSVLSADSC